MRFWKFAFPTFRPIFNPRGVNSFAIQAFIVRYTLWPKFIARIAERIFVFLGPIAYYCQHLISAAQGNSVNLRVSGAVRATDMLALFACLTSGCEEGIAFVASSSDTLAGLLMDKILASRLAWALKNNVLLYWAIIGQYRGVVAVGFDLSSSPFTTSDDLSLGALWWVPRAFGATTMAAVGAFFSGAKGSVAAMAGPSNAHSNGLIHTKDGIARDGALPFHGMNLQAKSLIQLLCPLFKKLQLREPTDTGHSLIQSSRLCGFGVDMADTISRFC